MSETKEKTPEQVRTELAQLIYEKAPIMTAEYKQLISHTGSLVTLSMATAYNRALNDVIKLIFKQNQGDNNVQKEESSESTSTSQS